MFFCHFTARTHPITQPVLLVEFTEVQVVPKNRFNPSPFTEKVPDSQTPEKKPSHHLQFQHLRNNSQSSSKEHTRTTDNDYTLNDQSRSTVARAISLISSFFPTAGEEEKPQSLDDSYGEFVPLNLEFLLHVVPYTRVNSKPLPLVVQATTVYISASTYVALYGAVDIPPCFVAVIQKIELPDGGRDRKTNSIHHQKSSKDLKIDDSASKSWSNKSRNSPVVNDERQPLFESVCVTVMIVQSAEEDEFDLPESIFYTKDCIVVHRELKRCLNLEGSSLVRLVSVQSKPVSLSTIVIHPFELLVSLV